VPIESRNGNGSHDGPDESRWVTIWGCAGHVGTLLEAKLQHGRERLSGVDCPVTPRPTFGGAAMFACLVSSGIGLVQRKTRPILSPRAG